MTRILSDSTVVALTNTVLQLPSEDSPHKDLCGVEGFAWNRNHWVDVDEVGMD
jgi:hypothetical protein